MSDPLPPPPGPLYPLVPPDGAAAGSTYPTATAALVLGMSSPLAAFLGLIVCFGIGQFLGLVLGILGLVLGIRSRNYIRASAGQLGGEGLALAGAIMGGIGAALSAILLVAVVLLLVAHIGTAISSGGIHASPSP